VAVLSIAYVVRGLASRAGLWGSSTLVPVFLWALQPTAPAVAALGTYLTIFYWNLFNMGMDSAHSGGALSTLATPDLIIGAGTIAAAKGLRVLWLHNGFRRAFHVYFVASFVISMYVAAKVVTKGILKLDDQCCTQVYGVLDGFMAPFISHRFVALRSIWVKIGQYLSGRTDITPVVWQEAFAVMQNNLPGDSIAQIGPLEL